MCVCVVCVRDKARNMTRILDNDEYVAAAKRLFIARSINIGIVTLPPPARVSPTLYRVVIARSLQEIINPRTLYYLLMKQHVSSADGDVVRLIAALPCVSGAEAGCVPRYISSYSYTRPHGTHTRSVVFRMIKETNNFEKPPI